MPRPEWSHRDGSSLCPVIGPSGGYRPAQPAEAAPGTGTRSADAARVHPLTPKAEPGNWDPSSRFGPLHDNEGQLIEGRIAPQGGTPAGRPGNLARKLSAFRAARDRAAAAIGRKYPNAAIPRLAGPAPPPPPPPPPAAAEPADREAGQ